MSGSARKKVTSLLAVALAISGGRATASTTVAAPDSARVRGAPQDSARAFQAPDSTRAPASPDSAHADSARAAGAPDGLPVRRVVIEAHDIFDPVPHGHLHAFYGIANVLHIRTRESTVRSLTLIQPGDTWSMARGAEATRRLRELDFLSPRPVVAQRAGDSVDVVVRTFDTWTTSPQLEFQSLEGVQYLTFSIEEGNLLGLGKSLSLTYHEEPGRTSRGFEWNDPAVLGSPVRFDFAAARGTSGIAQHLDGGLPFYAPSSQLAAFGDWHNVTGIGRLYAYGVETTNLDMQNEVVDLMYGRAAETDGTVLRWAGSFHASERDLGESRAVSSTPAPPEFSGGEENLRLRRLALEGVWWKPHYIERVAVNRMTRIEDFDTGTRLSLKLGYAPRAFGSTASEGYLLTMLDAGARSGKSFGLLHASLETRYRRAPRDEIQALSARWVAVLPHRQSLIFAGLGMRGIQTARDFQLRVGGLNGLRAYPIYELTGTSMLRFNVEDRISGPELFQLVSLGGAAFYDAAHMTGPGADGTPWHQDAGLGLRIGFSRSAINQVVRVDFAAPISPSREERHRVVLSFASSQAF